MTADERIPLVSVEKYLEGELASDVKHEYLEGFIYAMAGAKTVHNRIAGAFYGCLFGQLRGQPCEPFSSDMKVRVQTTGCPRFYYPDGMVVCDPNPPDDLFQDRPAVIAEVLSDSTRRLDQGEKREAYFTLPSLRVYLLVETDQPQVVAYRLADEAASGAERFVPELYRGLQAIVPLEEIGASLPLKELYERVELSTDRAAD